MHVHLDGKVLSRLLYTALVITDIRFGGVTTTLGQKTTKSSHSR